MNDGIYNTRTNERKIEKSIGDYPPSSKQIFIYAVSKISWGCLCKNKLERQKPAGQQTAHFAKTTWPPFLIFHALFRPLTIKKKKKLLLKLELYLLEIVQRDFSFGFCEENTTQVMTTV